MREWCPTSVETANWVLTVPLPASGRYNQAIALLGSGVPIREVARELGYSTGGNFAKSFRGWAGCTPTEWLVQNEITQPLSERVADAERLLASGRYTIAGAAKLAGFSSGTALSVAFKRVHGRSATQWLSENRNALDCSKPGVEWVSPSGRKVLIESRIMPPAGRSRR
ncbi:helix-turn-helix domain-containing protein [Sphingomonas canadensis]|uniref:Helix-turn-helix domain-containing protein n=1 Tax=Sphingomonas canadensis TaxID=1219257 RepID=A0ABW3H3P8_9SPHN